jgi:hypothetical protein
MPWPSWLERLLPKLGAYLLALAMFGADKTR